MQDTMAENEPHSRDSEDEEPDDQGPTGSENQEQAGPQTETVVEEASLEEGSADPGPQQVLDTDPGPSTPAVSGPAASAQPPTKQYPQRLRQAPDYFGR